MMRVLPVLFLIGAGYPSLALAQVEPGSATVQGVFRGSAPSGCRVSTPAAPVSENAQVTALNPNSADIAISQLVGVDGQPQAATISLTLPAMCNQAHSLRLNSLQGGLASEGPALSTEAFRNRLPYTVTVGWGGSQYVYSTTNDTLTVSMPDAVAGDVAVTIQIPSGGTPLVAGAYSDQLVLELGAAG